MSHEEVESMDENVNVNANVNVNENFQKKHALVVFVII